MNIEQKQWTKDEGWVTNATGLPPEHTPQLVLVFGGREELETKERFEEVRGFYPDSHIISCSTAGEILDTGVYDHTIVVTAIYFEKTTIQVAQTSISQTSESKERGITLAESLPHEGLVHAMVFSDGLKVNGTSLVEGLVAKLPENVAVTGGLVGDGADFKRTVVGLDAAPTEGGIVLIGFYGDSLKVGYGSLGGWDPFGPERHITKSEGNVLYELDGKNALKLYKDYLGEEAEGLPGTGLLFPLSLRTKTEKGEVETVRTLLAVNEEDQSMTFAGDMPKGTSATLMKANFDRLIDGAAGAATMSKGDTRAQPDLAILISCVGRKLVLKDRIEEETEAVRSILGKEAVLTGFYSYGELCPTTSTEKQCQLHNQTMTITTFEEV